VQFDTKSKEAPEISKKARMEQEISRLSSREKNLAQQYFNMIDQNNDGAGTLQTTCFAYLILFIQVF
jgi:hypothetical protein